MPKSKNRKGHKEKLAKYKINLKNTEAARKKKLIEEYIKMQQELMASKEAHTSTEEVVGPDVNVDELVEDWDSVDLSNIEIPLENISLSDISLTEDQIIETNTESNDNNNKQ
jgi:hypothetical protein